MALLLDSTSSNETAPLTLWVWKLQSTLTSLE
jgi:hypothetical protein